MTRPRTPPRQVVDEGGRISTVIVVQRCCPGCGGQLGDITDEEMDAAVAGRPLPDARAECSGCSGQVFAPPPVAGQTLN